MRWIFEIHTDDKERKPFLDIDVILMLFIINFEQISHLFNILIVTLNREMIARNTPILIMFNLFFNIF